MDNKEENKKFAPGKNLEIKIDDDLENMPPKE